MVKRLSKIIFTVTIVFVLAISVLNFIPKPADAYMKETQLYFFPGPGPTDYIYFCEGPGNGCHDVYPDAEPEN